MKKAVFVVMVLLCGTAMLAKEHPVTTVSSVDLARYSGKWFEIGRLPNRFQRDCIGATAEYGLRDDGAVSVVNTCYREDGSTRSIEGKAEVRDEATNAKLQVRFNGLWFKLFSWLIKADYWVIDLAEDYSYAVVGTPNRDYLWILSRTRTMDETTYRRITERVEGEGFDADRIVRTTVPEIRLERGD